MRAGEPSHATGVVEVSTDWIVQFPRRKSIRVLQLRLQLQPAWEGREAVANRGSLLPRSVRRGTTGHESTKTGRSISIYRVPDL